MSSKEYKVTISLLSWQGGHSYVAEVPGLCLAGHGDTPTEALGRLEAVVAEYYEEGKEQP